jgi:hypothetical protein
MTMRQRYEFFAPIWRVMRDDNMSADDVAEQVGAAPRERGAAGCRFASSAALHTSLKRAGAAVRDDSACSDCPGAGADVLDTITAFLQCLGIRVGIRMLTAPPPLPNSVATKAYGIAVRSCPSGRAPQTAARNVPAADPARAAATPTAYLPHPSSIDRPPKDQAPPERIPLDDWTVYLRIGWAINSS